MSQKAAIRRRRQAANGFKHLPPLHRPKYRGYSATKAANKAKRVAAKRAAGNQLAGST